MAKITMIVSLEEMVFTTVRDNPSRKEEMVRICQALIEHCGDKTREADSIRKLIDVIPKM